MLSRNVMTIDLGKMTIARHDDNLTVKKYSTMSPVMFDFDVFVDGERLTPREQDSLNDYIMDKCDRF